MADKAFTELSDNKDVSIASSASASSELFTDGMQPLGIELPAAFDANTAYILFKVGWTSGALGFLKDKDGNLAYISVAATNTNTRVWLDANTYGAGWRYIQVHTYRDNTGTTAQAQTNARTITLIMGKVV